MLRWLLAGAMIGCFAASAFSQGTGPTPSTPNGQPAAAPAPAPAAAPLVAAPPAAAPPAQISMPEPQPGDHWTYEMKDQISGMVKRTQTDLVTDISKNTIGVRFDRAGTNSSGNAIYDLSWNIVRNAIFNYSPNDGTGIRSPLTVGAQWKFTSQYSNLRDGSTWRRSGTSRVTGRESVTTKAGTFDAFVIETNYVNKSTRMPAPPGQISERTWYSPDIDHWVKRTLILRRSGHVFQDNAIELIDYGRKKG